jgi:hypothetical protein
LFHHYYQENNDGTIIFGIYNKIDLQLLQQMNGKVGVLWGGSDIMIKSKLRDKVIKMIKERKYENLVMSKYIWDKLEELKVENKRKVCVSFCSNHIDYITNKFRKGDKIFIYDGIGKSKKKNDIYNCDIIDKFCKGKNNIIRTSDSYIENMLDIYKNTYVSLRLTNYDGNANTAQECGMLGIPVISNQEMNHCISWSSLEEIEWKVNYIRRNNIKIHWEKDGVNLLIMSNDEVGKGGGATYTSRLVKYLRGRGFNVKVVYWIDSKR